MRPRLQAGAAARPLNFTVRCPSMHSDPLRVRSGQQGKTVTRLVLRHSIVPYRTLGTFFLALAVWGLVVSFRSGKWGTFESALLLCGYIRCRF